MSEDDIKYKKVDKWVYGEVIFSPIRNGPFI